MWLLYRLRYNNKTADERSTASVPSSSIFLIQILLKLCLTLVLLTKTLLRHYPSSPLCTQPLEFGTFLACTWKRRALVSQIIAYRVTIATWASSLAPPVILGGVGDEAVMAECFCWRGKHFIETSVFQVHGFANEEVVDSGRDCLNKVTNTLY